MVFAAVVLFLVGVRVFEDHVDGVHLEGVREAQREGVAELNHDDYPPLVGQVEEGDLLNEAAVGVDCQSAEGDVDADRHERGRQENALEFIGLAHGSAHVEDDSHALEGEDGDAEEAGDVPHVPVGHVLGHLQAAADDDGLVDDHADLGHQTQHEAEDAGVEEEVQVVDEGQRHNYNHRQQHALKTVDCVTRSSEGIPDELLEEDDLGDADADLEERDERVDEHVRLGVDAEDSLRELCVGVFLDLQGVGHAQDLHSRADCERRNNQQHDNGQHVPAEVEGEGQGQNSRANDALLHVQERVDEARLLLLLRHRRALVGQLDVVCFWLHCVSLAD